MRKTVRAGFTLVELSLSMVFIGILSVSIVLIINNTVAAYRRGMTVNHINTVGMDLVDDMRSAVQNSSTRSLVEDCEIYYGNGASALKACEEDGAAKFAMITNLSDGVGQSATVMVRRGSETVERLNNMRVWGAFCTGSYSYIWNSGYFANPVDISELQRTVSGASSASLTYLDSNGVKQTIYGRTADGGVARSRSELAQPFRVLKVYDDRRSVCVSTVRPDGSGTESRGAEYKVAQVDGRDFSGQFDITNYPPLMEEPVELILTDDYSDLVIYDLDVLPPAESSTQKNAFYAVSFILGTIRGGINVKATGQACQPPNNEWDENFDYCAINKFNFAVQTGGGAL